MYEKCLNCGGEVIVMSDEGYRLSRIDMKFCSDKCKNDFNNNIRKAKRKIAAIKKSLAELDEIDLQYRGKIEFDFIRKERDILSSNILLPLNVD